MPEQPKTYHVGSLTYTRPQLAMVLFWLLWGDFCYMLMESVVPSILPLKFKALGASNMTMALFVTTLPMILNTIFNPIISFKSDRFRSRWGRRIPFLLFTLPMLVVTMLCVGFGDVIGAKVIHPLVLSMAQWGGLWNTVLGGTTESQVMILTIGVMMVIFSFFNTFANSVFWYLFNDVVPDHLLARFMSWFRLVSAMACALYNWFIFKYAESHMHEIYIGGAILYTVGFGMMCLMVKEGKYSAPPEYTDGQGGMLAAFKTYGKECFSIEHYWWVFLTSMAIGASWGIGTFGVFSSKSIGLDLEQIGHLGGINSLVMSVAILGSGWLADRFHPIRVVLVGFILQTITTPIGFIWVFWHPDPNVVYWFSLVNSLVIGVPIGALIGVYDPPLFMRTFPRSRYGQYCSANAMLRSIAAIIGGAGAGIYLDLLKGFFSRPEIQNGALKVMYAGQGCTGEDVAYRLIPLWSWVCTGLATFFMYKLFQSWKSLGGDEHYAPPLLGGSEPIEGATAGPIRAGH
ncbi:MAG: MFS transporter [Lentisphaeria bacterium]